MSSPSGVGREGSWLKQARKRKVLLIGCGISKSISPEINKKVYRELCLDIDYGICDIPEESFDSKLKEIGKDESVIGFNVTIPFKEKIIPQLSSLDAVAKVVGAVNLVTISADRKQFVGYNTDVDGVVASLSKLGLIGRSGQVAVILGSGGAARACVYSILMNGFDKVRIVNRTRNRAQEVALGFARHFPEKKIESVDMTGPSLKDAMNEADLVINSIPMTVQIPFEISFLSAPKRLKYLDLKYRRNPPLLKIAKAAGISSIDGSLMLVEQAARSFEILTGISAPRKTMMSAAKRETNRQ